MLKAVIASFIGTFLALAAVGIVAAIVVDRTIDRVAGEISSRIEAKVAAVREQAASVVARVRERAGANRTALAAALEAGRGKRDLLVAFGECVATYADNGDRPAGAVERCLQDYAWVEP